MEKLAYGLSLLTVVYIAFLYLTTKVILQDIFRNGTGFFFSAKKKGSTKQQTTLRE